MNSRVLETAISKDNLQEAIREFCLSRGLTNRNEDIQIDAKVPDVTYFNIIINDNIEIEELH